MMQILFTRNSLPLSWAIRHLTKEPVSHCALQLGEFVVHINLKGIQLERTLSFLEHQELVYSVPVTPPSPMTLFDILYKYWESRYDLSGLLYLGLRCLLPFLPKANLWQTTGMFLCTEFITSALTGTEDHLITPYQLYLRLSKGL